MLRRTATRTVFRPSGGRSDRRKLFLRHEGLCKNSASVALDLTSGEITTVLWATGFRPDHSYVLGLPVLRTRASTYIHAAAADSQALVGHLHSFLSSRRR